ncbi:hypothetical protein [Budvicia aquatica]|uniref:hypothetical protein n=1 Tax=Budvicia aquatica TaxID=82979 RepID=UPI0021C41D6E|nr:hypothetical protein [Budvicia aquatica]
MMSIIVGLILLSVVAILYRGKNRRNVALALIIFFRRLVLADLFYLAGVLLD